MLAAAAEVVWLLHTYGISAAESHAAVNEPRQSLSATTNPPLHSQAESYADLKRWLTDFEVRQERKLHAIYEEIAELRTDIAALHTGFAVYSQTDSTSESQLYAPSAESVIERGVNAGWSQM